MKIQLNAAPLLVVLLSGCQGTSTDAKSRGPVDASLGCVSVAACDTNSAASDASSDGGGSCTATAEEHEPNSFEHLPDCSPIIYDTNPPSGGNHYGTWAAYQTYDFPVPPGFLVHEMEHGGVVIWYNCPEGCPGEVAQARAMIDALPDDTACDGYQKRVAMTPYPELTTRWAASSWGFTLRSNCLDAAAFTNFYVQHLGHGRELECSQGAVVQPTTCP